MIKLYQNKNKQNLSVIYIIIYPINSQEQKKQTNYSKNSLFKNISIFLLSFHAIMIISDLKLRQYLNKYAYVAKFKEQLEFNQYIIKMESVRKQLSKANEITVFLGFVLSLSSLYLNLYEETFKFPINSFYLLLTTTLIGIVSMLYYTLSRRVTFCLEIFEYILLPFSTFIVLDIIDNKASQYSVLENISAKVFSVIIGAVCLVKILFVNQIFPNNPNFQILHINIKFRLVRLFKLITFPFLVELAPDDNICEIYLVLINLLEVLLAYNFVNFVKAQIEIAAMIGSLSCFSNLLLLAKHIGIESSNGYIELGTVFIFIFLKAPFVEILEVRYLRKLSKFKNSLTDSFSETNEQRVIFFQSIYSLLNYTRGNRKVQWTQNFQKQIKCLYIEVIWHQKEQLHSLMDTNISIDNFNESMMSSYDPKKMKDIQSQTEKYQMARMLAAQEFQKGTNSKKPIFCELLSLTVNYIYSNLNKHDVIQEFFISFSCHISSSNTMKALLLFYKKQELKDRNFFNKISNKKVYSYIQYYRKRHFLRASEECELILFEQCLSELKREIKEACVNQAKLIEQMAKHSTDLSMYEQKLSERHRNKQKILKILQKSLQNWRYLLFQEFVYVYLLFKIIFCKSICLAQQQITQKFLSPKKENIMIKRFNQTQNQALVMCNGLKTSDLQFGSIVLFNTIFKKKFHFSPNTSKRGSTIGILIPDDKQRQHQELVEKYSKFNFQLSRAREHSEYDCYLKTNLENQNVCLLKSYQVNVKIFYGHPSNLLYICKLTQKQPNIYFTKAEYYKLRGEGTNSRSSRSTRMHSRHKNVEQMGDVLQLVEATPANLEAVHYIENHNELDVNQSMVCEKNTEKIILTENRLIDSKNSKFQEVERNIWSNSFGSRKISCLILASMILLISSIGSCYAVLFGSKILQKNSLEVTETSIKSIQSIQGFQMNFALSLMIIRAVNISSISDTLCQPYRISSLHQFMTASILDYVQGKFQDLFQENLEATPNKAPILNIFKQRIYHFPDFHHQGFVTDYLNYVFQANSMIMEYSSIDFNSLTPANLEWFKFVIHQLAIAGQIESNSSLINHIWEEVNRVININRSYISYLFYIEASLLCVLLIILVLILFKTYWEFMGYFKLLEKMDEEYFYNRINEVKFVSKEIQALESKRFKECAIENQQTISIKLGKSNDKTKKMYSFDSFQKMAEETAQQSIKISFNDRKEQTSEIGRVLYSKKGIFFLVFLLFGGMIGGSYAYLQNEKQFENTIEQAFDLFITRKLEEESFMGMLVSIWAKQFASEGYLTQTENQAKFQKHEKNARTSSATKKVIQIFKEKQTRFSLYSNICQGFSTESKKKICQERNFTLQTFAQLLPALWEKQKLTWKELDQGDSLQNIQNMCEATEIFYNYVSPFYDTYGVRMVNKFTKVHTTKSRIQLTAIIVPLALALIVFSLEMSRIFYSYTKVVRFEVMTFDTPRDLYKNENFRPYINRIYNSKGSY